ncbi:uncharacterized protein LOC108143697 [Drosophila elegans]|uniref:uncharacterized protein LOC108143697 n=1 Tax=Drosophila elegans TaxID=30023 RepID=UPI0007E72FB0|nr:uncharacterized protein LOC108143697 [Drosophila elegans]
MAYFVSSTTDQNYYFEDSIAYTEDHIRVRKLCWCDAPSKLEESTLCSHFAEFGHVLQIQTVRFEMDASMFQSGSVLYANDKDAARALMSTHMLNGVIFMVQPSDSWEQPDAYGTPEEEVNHQGPSPILALNDDCLEHIMAKLGLQDRLRFARSCLRFRAILQASASLHTSLDLIQFRRLTVWDIRDYFQLFGAHIQTLIGDFETEHSERLAEFIRDYCSSLRSIQVICNPQLGLHLHTMIANKSQLEELQLSNSDIDDEALFDLQDLSFAGGASDYSRSVYNL